MMIRKLKKTYYMSGAAITVGMLTAKKASAASVGMNVVAETVAEGTESIPGLIVSLSYLIGTLLAALGAMKIKDHVETPSQTPLKDGAIRLGVGGALFALPSLLSAMQGTLDSGDTMAIQGVGKASFTVE